jgi:hypothetical protein
MNYIKVTYGIGNSFIKSTFEDNSTYVKTSVNSTFIKVAYDGGEGGGGAWGSITGTLSDQTDLQTALDGKFDNPTGDTTQYIAGDGSLVAFPITGQSGTLVREVRNNTGATLTKGTICYINGAIGNKPTVAKAIATDDSTSAQTFGLIQSDLPNNSNGYIVAFGDLDGLDTSAFDEGVQLYLSSTTAGGYTSTKQYAPNHLVYIGVVTRQHVNQGRIEVRIQNGYEMDELHDVAAQTPSNNDGLFYNSTNSLWENKSIATALGYTSANAATTLTINGVTYDLSTSRSWTVSGGISGSGASGQVAYWNGTTSQAGSNNFAWNNTTGRLSITALQAVAGHHVGLSLTSSGITRMYFDSTGTGANWNAGIALTASSVSKWSIAGYGSTFDFTFYNDALNSPAIFVKGSTNNVILGGSTTDNGQKLQVQGTTLLNGNVTFSSSTGMFWDATNSRLGIGTATPIGALNIVKNDATIFLRNTDSNSYAGVNMNDDTNTLTGSFQIGGTGVGALAGNFFFGARKSTGKTIIVGGASATQFATMFSTGNFLIQNGGTHSDSGERLQVTGDVKITGSGTSSATSALRVLNSASTSLLNARNDGEVFIGSGQWVVIGAAQRYIYRNGLTGIFSVANDGNTSCRLDLYGSSHATKPNTSSLVSFFTPTSGSIAFAGFEIVPTINQTGGANGITRGLYVNPTLTAAADFRAIETSAGNVLFGSGFFWDNANSRLGIGTNAPALDFEIEKTTNGLVFGRIRNLSNGTNAFAGISIANDVGSASFQIVGSGNTVVGVTANQARFRTDLAISNGLNFATGGTSSIIFSPNDTERMRIFGSTGNLGIGTGSTDGGQRLQVQGTTLLNGNVTFSSSTGMFWDAANGRLGIGTNAPISILNLVSDNNVVYQQAASANFTGKLYYAFKSGGSLGSAMALYGQFSLGSVIGYGFSNDVGIDILKLYNNGNLLLQNGGTFTDSGQRLQVQGTTLLNGNVTFSSSTGMTWDASNSRLGIGTNAPQRPLHIYSNSGMWVQSPTGGNSILVITPTGFDTLNQNFIDFSITANSKMRLFSTGNLALGSTTDSGERLQVTGTMKVTGASTFNGNMSLSINGNLPTTMTISNTTSASNAGSALTCQTDTLSGFSTFGKYSTANLPFKIVSAGDGYLYNTLKDIAILNDAATGNIKFAAGGASTPHMTIKSNGRINMSSLPTSSAGLSTGDLWNDAGTIKIV